MTVTSGRCGYARWFWSLGHDPVNLFCRTCDGTAGKSQLQPFLETNMWVTDHRVSNMEQDGKSDHFTVPPPRHFLNFVLLFFLHSPKHSGSWCQAPANHLPNAPNLAKWLRLKETLDPVLSTTIQRHQFISRSKF